jgi:hypothetical protein
MLLSTSDAAAGHYALPLKGRLILAFLRTLVGAFKAGKTFVAQNTDFGGGLSDVTNFIDEKAPRKAFAGFGGGPARALMDAVV